jgi:hypothetical protein
MVVVCPIDIEGYHSWLPLVLLVFTIVYLVLGLAYMAAKFLQKPEYEARVKVEFSRQFISILFIILIMGFATILCTASHIVSGDMNPFDTASEFVAKIGLVDIPKDVNLLWESSINARKYSTITLMMPGWLNGVTYSAFPVGTFVSYHLDMLGMIIMPFSASMIVQILFLDIIQKYFLALLLPAGFLLKVTPFTRDAGAFLISFSLAFYFILPMFYVMGSLIDSEMGYQIKGNITNTVDSYSEGHVVMEWGAGAYNFDNNNSLKAIGRLAYNSMLAFTLPMLAVIVSIAGARALFPIFSKDFIAMVDM